MPLALRSVQPSFLGSHPVDSNVTDKKSVHFTISNNTLVGALLQLANVVRHADDIFCDIAEECQKVFERVNVINKRIIHLEEVVEKTDHKEVKIPVGDLKKFSHVDDHHVAKHGFDCHLFTQETRPQCISDLYSLSETTPTKIIHSCNVYRKDGLCGSRLFKLWPVVYNDIKIRTPDLNFPRRSPHVKSFQKRYKQLRERPKTIHAIDGIFEQVEDGKKEEESLFHSQPSILVAIDTSGANFERMTIYRRSLKDSDKDDGIKKKKRRRTVCGVPENIVNEIKQFEHKQRSVIGRRQEPRAYSFDDLEVKDIERDEAMTKYLDEIDNKIEERQEKWAIKEPRIMKFFPCRRTKSLPRCVKLGSSKNSEKRPVSGISNNYCNGSLSVSTTSVGSRLSKATKRSSIISNKLRLLVTGGDKEKGKPRPKSLDLDAIDFSSNEQNLAKARAPSMPDGMLNRTQNDLAVGPGTYYSMPMGSSTLPRARGKKYDFPWENLPKDWTTSVKLREISKRQSMEDRQSSSGHWSGTNSNRHSLDSDNVLSDGIEKSTSDFSLGKDSGRDSPTEDRCDDTSTTTKSDVESISDTKLDTESWLHSLAIRAANRKEVSSSSADTLDSLAKLTKKNIMALDMMSPDFGGRNIFDDEISSVYSVDQEGFYTSFHNDSGLRRSATDLLDDDYLSPGKDSLSVDSFCSNNTVDSVIHRSEDTDIFAGLRRGNSSQNKILSKVSPPTAPVRFSSLSVGEIRRNKRSSDSSESTINQSDFSFSESDQTDQEIVFARVKSKTKISPTMFPSWCSISASETDDDSLSEASSNMVNGGLRSFSNGLSYQNSRCEVVDMASYDIRKGQSGDAHGILLDNSFLRSVTEPSLISISNLSEGSMTVADQFCERLTLQSPSVSQIDNDHKNFQINSWPRSHHIEKYSTIPQGSILKTGDKSLGNAKPPKSLNFAPVIDMFNPATTQVEQRPLLLTPPSNGSNSKIADFGSINPTAGASYKLAVPIRQKKRETETNMSNLPMKYQPVITVTPRVKSSSASSDKPGAYVKLSPSMSSPPDGSTVNAGYETSIVKSSTPVPSSQSCNKTNLYALSPIKISEENEEDLKIVRSKERTNNSLDSRSSVMTSESGYYGMQSANVSRNRPRSMYSMGSSADLNFTTDSSYVSISGPCDSPNLSNADFPIALTPTGSVDSLAELRHTPMNYIPKAGNQMYVKTITVTKTAGLSDNTSSKNSTNFTSLTIPDPQNSPYSSSTSSLSSSSSIHSSQHQASISPSTGRVVVKEPTTAPSYSTKSLPRGKKSPETKHVSQQQSKDSTNVSTGTWPRRKMMSTLMSLPSDVCTYTGSNDSSKNQKQQKRNKDKKSNKKLSKPWKSSGSPNDIQCTALIDANSNHIYKHSMPQSRSYPLLKPSNRSGSHRVTIDDQVQSTIPADFAVRTDSYRVAVRKTNGIVPDIANRNSSYRVAVSDIDIVAADSKFEALSSRMPIGRDMRRMGITDVDQLKQIPDQQFSKTKSAGSFAQIRSSNKRMSVGTEIDPIAAVVSRTDEKKNDTNKSNKNANRSSTYICFDPIFEDREDVSTASSMESIRVPSTTTLRTDISSGTLHGDSIIFDKPSVNTLGNEKNGDMFIKRKSTNPSEKTGSVFQNIKSTIKSLKGKNTSKEEEWKFTVV